jgi:hypothetical protein
MFRCQKCGHEYPEMPPYNKCTQPNPNFAPMIWGMVTATGEVEGRQCGGTVEDSDAELPVSV